MKQGIIYRHRVDPIDADTVLHAAYRIFNTTRKDLTQGGRCGCLPYVRRIVATVLRGWGLSYDRVGAILEMTRHNVMYHIKEHDKQVERDADYKASYNALLDFVNKRLDK